MKPLKIWKPKEVEPPEEPQYFLRMVERDEIIKIKIVTEAGGLVAMLAHINPCTGALYRVGNIPNDLGFDLDESGRVKVVPPLTTSYAN